MRSVDDEVGRVRDRQHEARRVGDEGADEEVGQRLGLRRLGRRIDRRRQHHGAGIVREENRDHDADEVDEEEQARRRSSGLAHGDAGEPVEEPLLPGDLGKQHHADEKQVDIRPLAHAVPGRVRRDQAQHQQRPGAERGPDRLRPGERPGNDPERRQSGDDPDHQMRRHGKCEHGADEILYAAEDRRHGAGTDRFGRAPAWYGGGPSLAMRRWKKRRCRSRSRSVAPSGGGDHHRLRPAAARWLRGGFRRLEAVGLRHGD